MVTNFNIISNHNMELHNLIKSSNITEINKVITRIWCKS